MHLSGYFNGKIHGMCKIHQKNKRKTFQNPMCSRPPVFAAFVPFCVAKPILTLTIMELVPLNEITPKKKNLKKHFQTKRESECFCLRRGMKSTCFSNLLGCCCNTTSTTCQSDSCGDSQAQPTLFTDGKQGKITVWSEWFTVGSVSLNCYLANYSCAAGLSKKAWLFYWGSGDSINNFHSLSLTSPLIKSISPTNC